MMKKCIKSILIFILIISFINCNSFNLRSENSNQNIPHLAWISHKLVYENELIKDFEHLNFRKIESEDDQFRCNIISILNKNEVDIIVVFRGTELDLLKNIWADLNVTPIKLSGLCQGCQVHMGFYNAYETIKEKVILNLDEEIHQQSNAGHTKVNLYFTGHSLGGGIAAIGTYDFLNRRAAKDLKDLYFKTIRNVSLITFGCPRVGVGEFKEFFNQKDLLRDNLRIVYGDDVVPDLVAGHPLSYYRHNGDFAHFPENNFDEPEVFGREETDKWIRPGGIIDKFNFNKKIQDHRKYFLLNPKGVEYAIKKLRDERK